MTGKPCNCSLPVRDALMTWARAEGIEEPMPYGWKCGYCHLYTRPYTRGK